MWIFIGGAVTMFFLIAIVTRLNNKFKPYEAKLARALTDRTEYRSVLSTLEGTDAEDLLSYLTKKYKLERVMEQALSSYNKMNLAVLTSTLTGRWKKIGEIPGLSKALLQKLEDTIRTTPINKVVQAFVEYPKLRRHTELQETFRGALNERQDQISINHLRALYKDHVKGKLNQSGEFAARSRQVNTLLADHAALFDSEELVDMYEDVEWVAQRSFARVISSHIPQNEEFVFYEAMWIIGAHKSQRRVPQQLAEVPTLYLSGVLHFLVNRIEKQSKSWMSSRRRNYRALIEKICHTLAGRNIPDSSLPLLTTTVVDSNDRKIRNEIGTVLGLATERRAELSV